MGMQIYDTYAGAKRAFKPADPQRVTMYVCGPTVYGRAHIGNFRPAVVFDTLFRVLRARFGAEHVVYARNITDIEDKIIQAALAEGVDFHVVTDRFARLYRQDSRALNILPQTYEPTATAHITGMIGLIGALIAGGYAYQSKDGVYFHVSAMKDYGRLSKRDLEEMRAGARVDIDETKKDPADFALWKAAKPGEPWWDSPWGPGRPGWHIECSAMIEGVLGQTIDIHGGGHDLIFPHHENEIAQSCCAHGGAPLARFWLHNGFLDMEGEKMSKSLGNVKLVGDLLGAWPGEVLRLALLSAHYRAPLDWTGDLLKQSKATLDRWYRALEGLEGIEPADGAAAPSVQGALEDDLNTPEAFAAVAELVHAANTAKTASAKAEAKGALLAAGDLLGLMRQSPEAWFGWGSNAEEVAEIEQLMADRQAARAAKDWAEADRLRDAIAAKGYVIEDSPQGPVWRKAG